METRAWESAWIALEKDLRQPVKGDILIDSVARTQDERSRRITRGLLLDALRQDGLITAILDPLLRKRPRPRLLSLLRLAVSELRTHEAEHAPLIVDHAVGLARKHLSRPESGLANAVLRKVPDALASRKKRADSGDPAAWAVWFSHPRWLVDRWNERFGPEKTRWLLEWNQTPAPVYVRLPDETPAPDILTATEWPGYWLWEGGDWGAVQECLREGRAYVQDPLGLHPIHLAEAKQGETILDLCAAPGGKTTALARILDGTGTLVAWDLASRAARLEENLAPFEAAGNLHLLLSDALDTPRKQLEEKGLPTAFDLVMLDAPCTNTGVLRRRPDAKRRLTPDALSGARDLQQQLLEVAASLTRPGGRIVYSTCSLEPEENRLLVDDFLATTKGQSFRLASEHLSLPFQDGHDGGGAFLLRHPE